MERLYQKLAGYSREGVYPFHMPGHKRNPVFDGWGLPFSEDITEIDGFDNLHHAEGILREAQERLAALYKVRRSWFSVGGSTASILAMVSAALDPGEKLLIARNCHKAVYHAAYLRRLSVSYLYPETDTAAGISGDIRPEEVEEAFRRDKGIKAVLLTSPTYDGVVSDVKKIARIVHSHGAVLIVDEAHGAHLRFHDYFPDSAADNGADLVCQSFHKTLPAMTQTAVLHLCSDRVPACRIERFLDIYETSSPSYILMASLDRCVSFLEEEGEAAFSRYVRLLSDTREKLRADGTDGRIRLLDPKSCFAFDRSRILLSCPDGYAFSSWLRREAGIECEMAAPGYALLLTSVGDRKEGFDRLTAAAERAEGIFGDDAPGKDRTGTGVYEAARDLPQEEPLWSAMDKGGGRVPLRESAGKVSAEFLYLYPPGIPLVVPGERITDTLADGLCQCLENGISLQGLEDPGGKTIRIIC